METVKLELSPRVLEFLDIQAMQDVLEAEARRLDHIRRSIPLTQKEKDLRGAIGKEAYKRLTPVEKERMLACLE